MRHYEKFRPSYFVWTQIQGVSVSVTPASQVEIFRRENFSQQNSVQQTCFNNLEHYNPHDKRYGSRTN